MLIVDMPMQSRCVACPVRHVCDTYLKVIESSDDWEELKTCTPDEKCLIKGELVRCGECKYWDRSDPFFFNGVVRCECKRHENEYWTSDGFCSDAERNDSEVPNS